MHFKMYFIPVIKAEFSASLLLSSVSHDSNMMIWCLKTFSFIINLKKMVVVRNISGKLRYNFFSIDHLFKLQYKSLHHHFSLLNKIINYTFMMDPLNIICTNCG